MRGSTRTRAHLGSPPRRHQRLDLRQQRVIVGQRRWRYVHRGGRLVRQGPRVLHEGVIERRVMQRHERQASRRVAFTQRARHRGCRERSLGDEAVAWSRRVSRSPSASGVSASSTTPSAACAATTTRVVRTPSALANAAPRSAARGRVAYVSTRSGARSGDGSRSSSRG